MDSPIPRINFPELFFGFVSPVGTEVSLTVASFRAYFERRGYRAVEVKVTDVFARLTDQIVPCIPLRTSPVEDRIRSYIAYGNQVRSHFKDDGILAVLAILKIVSERLTSIDCGEKVEYERTVYLIHQFKRQEEIDLLRAVYGPLFFQVSIYSRRGARVDHLARRLAGSRFSSNINQHRAVAEDIIQLDENEHENPHGQRVGRIFHHADVIFSLDLQYPDHVNQVERFCELLFSSNTISPTRMEFGMFAAKAAALRTLDLSRQVGAAIFSRDAEIISMGANEVPKGNGGSYWGDGSYDGREFKRGFDSNDRRKREILSELAGILAPGKDVDELMRDPKIQDSQFMDALEYGRIVHAEMSAIADAGRLGRPLANTILYCTTFPCHMCAKQIVASGIGRVIFLEPYPKSLAADLHSDSIRVEGGDRGHFQDYPASDFEHFSGITPRRYREFFERGSRKDENGNLRAYIDGEPRPFVDVKFPFYVELERFALKRIRQQPEAFLASPGGGSS
jgi:deoxycytidylate deaminase